MENEEKIEQLKYDNNKYDIFFGCVVPDVSAKDAEGHNYLNEDGIQLKGIKNWLYTTERPFKCFSVNIAKKTGKSTDLLKTTHYDSGKMGYEFDINDRNFKIKTAGFHDIGSAGLDEGFFTDKDAKMKDNKNYYQKEPIDYVPEGQKSKNNRYYWNKIKCEQDNIDLRDILVPKMINRLESASTLLHQNNENNILQEDKQVSSEKLKKMTKQLYKNSNKNIDKSFTEDEYGAIIEGQDNISWKDSPKYQRAYALPNTRLAINNEEQNVEYCEYNEFVAFAENAEERVKPKRLFYMPEDNYTDENKENFIKACEKFFPQEQIRIIENGKTKLISIDQFKKDYMKS